MTNLKFYGLGGQGVVTAAKTLSTAVSIYEDKYAITVPAYGHERRGAPVFTDMVIDDHPILVNCFVYDPDFVIVLSDTIIDKQIDIGRGKHEATVLVLNTSTVETAQFYKDRFDFKKVYYINATFMALKNIGRGIPNGAMLGALARTGIVKIDSVESALKEAFGKAGDKNADAARESYGNVKNI